MRRLLCLAALGLATCGFEPRGGLGGLAGDVPLQQALKQACREDLYGLLAEHLFPPSCRGALETLRQGGYPSPTCTQELQALLRTRCRDRRLSAPCAQALGPLLGCQ